MSKKSFFLTSLFLLLMAAANISLGEAVTWTNNTGNQHWSDPNNWHAMPSDVNRLPYWTAVPVWQDDAIIVKTGSNGAIFDETDGSQTAWFVMIGQGVGVSGEMWMSGGTLVAPWGLSFNKLGNAASNSKLHMSGGLLYLRPGNGLLGIGRFGTADCNMTGGEIKCVSFKIPDSGASTVGTFELNGGVVSADSLTIGAVGTGTLSITQGRLIIKGDARTTVSGYVSSSKIVAYPGSTGRRIVNVDYNTLSDANTTVTASCTEPNQAWNPQPIDTHPGVSQPVLLSWTPGDVAVSHDVYLGTSFSDVDNGLVTPVTRDVNNYSPDGLVAGQTYYWRVDEIDGSDNVYKGVVWSFTITNGAFAVNPDPDNGATGIATSADLSWTAGVGGTSHDVYFGISFSDVNDATDYTSLPGRGRQTATTYDPGTLVLGQKYYWRIDEYDGSVVSRGSVWSFTTVPAEAQALPSPYLGDLIGYGDGAVTLEDMEVFASEWLTNSCKGADLSGDCDVDFVDYSTLAEDWLKAPPECHGTVYYVATSGNDTNPGTVSLPWATIQKAAGVMKAGDTVIVGPGTYNGQVTVANSGDSQGCGLGDMPITFLADQSGDVTLNANGSSNNGFYIVAKAYIVIDGFKITGGRDGIFFDGDSASYHVIRNCKIYDNGRDGIRIYKADRVTVEKCLLYGNTGAGIKTADDVGDLYVSKSGIYGNDKGLDLAGSSDVNDCIITNNTTYGVQGDASQVVTYSDVWNNDANYYGGIDVNTGCISVDPCYVNPVSDFHLLAGSPCIGTASDGENMGYKHPPIANAGPDQTTFVNEVVTFDASASKGDLVSYVWDFNDTNIGSGKVVTHTYTSAGDYTVSLDVNDGTATDAGTCIVEVRPARLEERVYHVINLNASGAGSFVNCLNLANSDDKPSRIVFDVSGTIYPGTSLSITDSNTTICGTEVPSPGITFDFDADSSGFAIDGNNCRMCNITVTNTKLSGGGYDGIVLNGQNNVLERCTTTYCTDEGVSVMEGYGHVVAFCRIENCGSITETPNGRGLSVWYGSGAIVVGNYIGDNLRGVLCGDYGSGNFMDFRNNLVTLNHQTFGLKVSTPAQINIIDNTIINNSGAGIKYADGAEFYRSGNIIYGNTFGEIYDGAYTERSSEAEREDTPFPNWLENITTPTDKTQVGMGSGKCQCLLCR